MMLLRDQFRCRKCGVQSLSGDGLEANHVIGYADGGATTLANLHTLCTTCHAELSWVWANSPPVPYERWLQISPAGSLLQILLMLAGEINEPPGLDRFAAAEELGIPIEIAERLIRGRQ